MALCRIIAEFAPLIQQSPAVLMTWHEHESTGEESETVKVKCEYEEDNWSAHIAAPACTLPHFRYLSLSHNRLLEHTRKPVSPPPDAA